MTERVEVLDIGVVPEAAVSGAVLLQSEQAAFLLFNAMRRDAASGVYNDAGLAACRFGGCLATRFGYPNDEAWSAIPRTRGMAYDVCEVFDSAWKREVDSQNRHAFPGHAGFPQRHFLVLFHDSSFECLAMTIEVELTREPLAAVMARLGGRLNDG